MTYLVLARKWRPQVFSEVIGQPHVTRTLQSAIRSRRIAHAYLFAGARGVGKTSVARIFAKALNCEKGVSIDPCNECSLCREITQGSAMDVLEIDGASNRGIDNIRELCETIRYRPVKGRYKVYIIDEVHMLTGEAFNALLKTLEEPPPHVIFILATTEPHKIPATIASRCQRFDFRRIPSHLIMDHLKGICRKEGVEYPDKILYAIALEADGSMRDAQSLLEQLLAFQGDDLPEDEILDLLGVIDRRSIHRVAEAIMEGDSLGCMEVVAELYRRGVDSKQFCRQLSQHFRNLLLVSLDEGNAKEWLDVPEEERKALLGQREKTSVETLHLYLQILLKGEEEIRRSTQPRFALEMVLLRMSQLPRLRPLDELLRVLNTLVHQVDGKKLLKGIASEKKAIGSARLATEVGIGTSSESHQHSRKGTSPEPVSGPEDVVHRWPEFIRWLQDEDPILAAKLAQSRLTPASDGNYDLEVLELFESTLRSPPALEKLKSALGSYFRMPIALRIRSRSGEDRAKVSKKGESSRSFVVGNPIVQEALEIFGGELVEIKDRESKDH